MAKKANSAPKPLASGTRLTVICEEDAFGNFNVEWGMVDQATGQTLHPRPTHVLGQLFTAASLIASEVYPTLKSRHISRRAEGGDEGQKAENT